MWWSGRKNDRERERETFRVQCGTGLHLVVGRHRYNLSAEMELQ